MALTSFLLFPTFFRHAASLNGLFAIPFTAFRETFRYIQKTFCQIKAVIWTGRGGVLTIDNDGVVCCAVPRHAATVAHPVSRGHLPLDEPPRTHLPGGSGPALLPLHPRRSLRKNRLATPRLLPHGQSFSSRDRNAPGQPRRRNEMVPGTYPRASIVATNSSATSSADVTNRSSSTNGGAATCVPPVITCI